MYYNIPVRVLELNDSFFIKGLFSTSSEDTNILQNFLTLLCYLYIQGEV